MLHPDTDTVADGPARGTAPICRARSSMFSTTV